MFIPSHTEPSKTIPCIKHKNRWYQQVKEIRTFCIQQLLNWNHLICKLKCILQPGCSILLFYLSVCKATYMVVINDCTESFAIWPVGWKVSNFQRTTMSTKEKQQLVEQYKCHTIHIYIPIKARCEQTILFFFWAPANTPSIHTHYHKTDSS